jgi:TATA-box binding protein (TBP) (component of TFIID and TFIIIB)
MDSGMDIVNVVGSGSIGVEIDLEQLAATVAVHEVRYNPETHPIEIDRFGFDWHSIF